MYKTFTLGGGQLIRLEMLTVKHLDGLVAAAANGKELYRWSAVPQTREHAEQYVRAATNCMKKGAAVPFAILSARDGRVIGSTRFWQLEHWSWPASHLRHGRIDPDVCEIGYTWLSPSTIRTGANIETKLLMLAHAFELWRVLRVCFHPDHRNELAIRSLAKLGATREGVLREHRLGADDRPSNSVRFSILAEDWPAIKDRLIYRLTHHPDAHSAAP
ncbi:MAG TPA: GNAT family protein [Rhizomicrobium sp.]|nr:GNAT family protein [Rhizomicrobium sp.]